MRLSEITIEEQELLVSYNFMSLFRNIPVQESISLIHEKLLSDPTLSTQISLTPQQVSDLLQICLTTTYFKYIGEFYAQVEGAAMESPTVANLFMVWFEAREVGCIPVTSEGWTV